MVELRHGRAASRFIASRDQDETQAPDLVRRQLLGAALTATLAGCANMGSPVVAGWQSYRIARKRTRDYPMSAEQIAALPYASLGVQVGDGLKAVVVLAKYDGDKLDWISGDRVVFVTRGGRLVRTVGLPRDLRNSMFQVADPLTAVSRHPMAGESVRYVRRIDVTPDDEFGVAVESELSVEDPEEIRILDRVHATTRLRERVRVRRWDWRDENLYWADVRDGFIWRSRQLYCSQVPPITMEILKRPAPAPASNA